MSLGPAIRVGWSARTAAAAALLGVTPGCSSEMSNIEAIIPQEDDCSSVDLPADGQAALLLGTIEGEEFRSLKEGEPLTIHYGPQGGQHVYAAVKLYSPVVATWVHTFEVLQAPMGLPAGGVRSAVEACGGAWTISQNIIVFLDHDKITAGTLKLDSAIDPELGSTKLFAETKVTFTK